MEDKSGFPKHFRYEYEQDTDIRLQVAHGVWGGINTHGEIELNFYSESDKLPLSSEKIFNAEGMSEPELVMPSEDETRTVIRRVHSKILLNYNTVRALVVWLEEQVDHLEMSEVENYLSDDKEIEQ